MEDMVSRDHAHPFRFALDWLAARLQRKPADQLTAFRRAPSEDEALALRLEKLELDRLDALRAGARTHNAYTNVAYGTPGYVARSLVRDGLMVCDVERSDIDLYHYRITPKGVSYLQSAEQNP